MSAGSRLALVSGPRGVQDPSGDLFQWPIITQDDEEAVLEVLRRGAMSSTASRTAPGPSWWSTTPATPPTWTASSPSPAATGSG